MSRIERAIEKARGMATQESSPESARIPAENALASGRINIESSKLIAANDYNLLITEEYRKLKSIIVQITRKNPEQNLLLVTSSIGGEGKSMTSLNLAVSLAQEHDQKVLLIDADLRKPSVGKYLGLTADKGLSEYLKGNLELEEILIETGLGTLTFLPAGTPESNPVELFSSQKMKTLLANLRKRFKGGYIVIDSSPVLPFAEARILANLADGVVYVVKESGTSLKNIQEGLNSLFETKVIGLVYNKATTAGLAGGYHYYYYDYDYQPRSQNLAPAAENTKNGFFSRFRKSNPAS